MRSPRSNNFNNFPLIMISNGRVPNPRTKQEITIHLVVNVSLSLFSHDDLLRSPLTTGRYNDIVARLRPCVVPETVWLLPVPVVIIRLYHNVVYGDRSRRKLFRYSQPCSLPKRHNANATI